MGCYLKQETLIDVSNQLRSNEKKVVLTHGAFDLFHIGHSEMLKESKRLGDYLIVGLDSDERIRKYKGIIRPIIPLKQRIEILLENKAVDFVFTIDDPLEQSDKYFFNLYQTLNPGTVTYGRNFGFQKEIDERQKIIKGSKFVKIIHKYDNQQSTTNIITKIVDEAFKLN